jgi:hypothetical protein
MRISCKVCLTVIMVGTAVTAPAQTLAELQEEWRAINSMPPPKKFDQLIPQLLAYREQAGGKSWQLNYMLGSSYCRTAGQEGKGKIALHRVLGSYGLPDAARVAAEKVISNCGGQSVTVQEPAFSIVAVSGQMGAVVHGKGGYEVSTRSELTNSKLQASPIAVDELQRRVFKPDHSAEAVKAAVMRDKNPAAKGVSIDGLVVTSSLDLPPYETGDCLARYRHPLESQFNMQSPAALITVYTVAPEQVPEYAARLHGVNLPFGTVAYSVYDDLSIVGIASFRACGSLAHELVHLSIRQNFGDSPAWLEEGLASEVAVATPEQDAFRFHESWRDDVLHRHWDLRPSVSELLSKTWGDYAANDMSQVNRVAALQAMAASFIRYLDTKQKLVPVYLAMRDSMSSPSAHSDQDILEAKLGMSLEQIDADFVRWFERSLLR